MILQDYSQLSKVFLIAVDKISELIALHGNVINTLLKVKLKSIDKLLVQLQGHSFNKGCSFLRGSKGTRIETYS